MKDLFEQFSTPTHTMRKSENCDYSASDFENEHKLKTILNGSWDEQCSLSPMDFEEE